jgi:hypothetical protein
MLLLTPPPIWTPPKVTTSFCVQTGNASALTTYTFAGHSIGAAPAGALANRTIFVVINATDAVPKTINSVTVGGVAMSEVFTQQYSGSGDFRSAWYAVRLPNSNVNTTADIVVTWSAGVDNCTIAVFAVYNLLSLTPIATVGSQTLNASSTLNINSRAGGVVLGHIAGNASGTATWTGLTEDSDSVVGTRGSSAAHLDIVATSTPLSVSADLTGTQTAQVASAISLR